MSSLFDDEVVACYRKPNTKWTCKYGSDTVREANYILRYREFAESIMVVTKKAYPAFIKRAHVERMLAIIVKHET